MNFDLYFQRINSLSFRQAVWFFPLVYALHVLEELPQFTHWAQHYASASYTMRDYVLVHLSGLIVALVAPSIIWLFPTRAVLFTFFSFVLTPAIFFNILFHAGATAAFGAYCPGLLTALTLYAPLFFLLSRLAFREHLMTNRLAGLSFMVAGITHTADVAHNVFKVL